MVVQLLRKTKIRLHLSNAFLAATTLLFLGSCDNIESTTHPVCANPQSRTVEIQGGAFSFGAVPVHLEEGPAVTIRVGAFDIDRTEVTNDQFARFVAATNYVTLAERKPDPRLYPNIAPSKLKPSSIVFVGVKNAGDVRANGGWRVVEGANWRHPLGPNSSIAGKGAYPVVQIGWADADAYAKWAGRELPTEAEWEFAARGGLEGKKYVWGDEHPTKQQPRANHWQGIFPFVDEGSDGYKAQTAPVACYPANGYGLYDMAGNVWEWTADWYAPNPDSAVGPAEAEAFDPSDATVRKHVIKGGSFLCADNFCYRYRPSARQAGPPDTGTSHLGFRTIKRHAN